MVRLASSKHGPDNPCVLIGDRNRSSVEAPPLLKLCDPLAHGIILVGPGSHNSTGAMDQEAA